MLPIKKVVLYKHGVGYFERQDKVQGNQAIDLYFKKDQMNDILKSLTVLDLSGGNVSSISYESTEPLEKQLADSVFHLQGSQALSGLLSQAKGAEVEVQTPCQSYQGVLLGVESVDKEIAQGRIQTFYVSLLCEGHRLKTFDLLDLQDIAFLDPALQKDLQHVLNVMISSKKKDLKKLTLFTQGEGERELLATYLIESPVWKTSYRMLLENDKPAFLQGWALVDNTQDEDWEQVTLSLVSGLPISFRHDLYSPRYKQRPEVKVKEEAAYAPPVLEAAEFETLDYFADAAGGSMDDLLGESLPPPPPMPMAAAAPTRARSAKPAPGGSMAMRSQARKASTQVQTRTQEIGDMFEYQIANPVTVKRGQSALVPILQSEFKGRRVAIFNEDIHDKHPMSALEITNNTGLTLEGGPVTVIQDETYVGEAMLETIKPDEEQILPFAIELGCRVNSQVKQEPTQITHYKAVQGVVHQTQFQIKKTAYRIRSMNKKPLTLFLEHRFIKNWDLLNTEDLKETTENFYRFALPLPEQAQITYEVTEKSTETRQFYINNLNVGQISIWLDNPHLPEEVKAAFLNLANLQEKVAQTQKEIAHKEQDIRSIFSDQERLRKNLGALGSSREEKGLRERYIQELTRSEDTLKHLQDAQSSLREIKEKQEAVFTQACQNLNFEVALD